MPADHRTRRRFFPALILFILVAGGLTAYLGPEHGSDLVVSSVLSRMLGAPVRITGVHWDSFRRLHFKKAQVSSPAGEDWIRTGSGKIRWTLSDRWIGHVQIVFSQAVVGRSLLSGFLGKSGALPLNLASRDFFIESGSLELRRSGGDLDLWVRSLRSKDFNAQGGFRWKKQGLDVAHIMLQVSSSLLKGAPNQWLRRLPVNDHDQRSIKCSFRNRQLTLFGRSGPMLRASWEMAYTTSP